MEAVRIKKRQSAREEAQNGWLELSRVRGDQDGRKKMAVG